MNRTNIYQNNVIKQVPAMDSLGYNSEERNSFMHLLHSLIREYGTYKNNDYSVDVNHFSLSDKRLIISHYESAEWYEYACESINKTEELFKEHAPHLQRCIDQESYDVYIEDMEEMRAYK